MENTASAINHGGWISEPFSVQCGIRQGCPFSPLAFVLAVEILAIKIRNSNIKGIKVPSQSEDQNTYIKIKQMADDTTLFLEDKNDMDLARDIFTRFQNFSGLKLNTLKTKALRIGNGLIEDNLPYTLVTKIKILGIFFETIKCQKILKTTGPNE